MTGTYFQTLGLVPFRGRLIQAVDDDPPARVAVVSHLVWRTRLAEDPDVVGKTIRIGGQPFEIVGVAPEGFGGLSVRFQPATGAPRTLIISGSACRIFRRTAPRCVSRSSALSRA